MQADHHEVEAIYHEAYHCTASEVYADTRMKEDNNTRYDATK